MVSRRDSWILFKLDTRDTMDPVDVFVSNQEICFLPASFPVPVFNPSTVTEEEPLRAAYKNV